MESLVFICLAALRPQQTETAGLGQWGARSLFIQKGKGQGLASPVLSREHLDRY